MQHQHLPRPSYDRVRAEETRRLKNYIAAKVQARLADSLKPKPKGVLLSVVDFLIKLFVTTCVSLTVVVMIFVVFYKYFGG